METGRYPLQHRFKFSDWLKSAELAEVKWALGFLTKIFFDLKMWLRHLFTMDHCAKDGRLDVV